MIPAMILLIDNYDSFTWNLVQRIGELDASLEVHVVRNDRITSEEAEGLGPSHVIVSPGPCTPREAGVSNDIIRTFAGRVPLLGVCLGHQCMGAGGGMRIFCAGWGRSGRRAGERESAAGSLPGCGGGGPAASRS